MSRQSDLGQRKSLLTGVSLLAAAAAAFSVTAPTVALAQEADDDEAIVVTGTRIARRDYSANSPITTVGQDELQLSGIVTVESLLNELPQVVPGLNSTSNNPGLNGQATVDLRGLGPARTLVLIDGHRLAPSDKQGTVDLNLIPASLIQSIEVVTGGASAVYGSDAVAGVVNFILNDEFEGVELGGLYGVSEQGDAKEYAYDITVGGPFAEGRGNATMFVGYYNRDPLFQSERSISDTCHPFFCSSRIPNGTLINSILNPFPAGGSLKLDDAGDEWDPTEPNYNYAPVNLITLPAERFTFGMFANYDITDSIELYSRTLYADSFTSVQLAPSPLSSTNGISIDPTVALGYLPGLAVQAQINGRSDPNARILLQRRMLEWGPRIQTFDKNFLQTSLGLRGEFGEGWSWDVSYQYSETDMYDALSNDVSKSRLQQALDNCPVGSDPGCVSFDPFGEGSATPDVVAFTSLDNVIDHHNYVQEVFTAAMTGEVFDLPAGPIGVAFGFEWRADELSFTPAPASTGDLVGFNGVTSSGGSTDVTEVFGEVAVPLIADAPFAQYIGLEAGFRLADYSTAGQTETYKIGGEWAPIDGMRFRAMYNVATRAPSVFELFRAGDQNFPGYADPCQNAGGQAALNGAASVIGSPEWNFCAGWLGLSTAPVDQPATDAVLDTFGRSDSQVEAFLFGNPDLNVEESETMTIGVVLGYDIGPGHFRAAIDYYDIEVTDPIGNPNVNTVIQRCVSTLNLASPECLATPRITSGQLGGVVQRLENLSGGLETRGIDVQVGYALDMFGGRLDVSALMTFLDDYVNDGTDYAGVAYGLGLTFPEFKSSVRATYQYNDWQFSWQWEHISELDDYTYSSLYGYPYIDAIDYHDFSVRWFMTENVDLTVTCENCLDQDAQAGTIHGAASGPNVDTSLYDILGRYFRVGLRARF